MIERPHSGYLKTEDAVRIHYDHYQCGHKNLIIIAHGFFNSKQSVLLEQLARELTDTYDVLAIDFRGHGKSGGWFTWTSKEHLDLKAVLEHVRSQYERIGVIGFSLGAAITISTAYRTRLIDSIIAVSPPVDFWKIENHLWNCDVAVDIGYHFFGKGIIGQGCRPGPIWLKKDSPIDLIGELKIPIAFIHGEKDWLIHPWHAQALYDKTVSTRKLAVIPNGPHAEYLLLKEYKSAVMEFIKDWFDKTLVKD